MIIRAVAFPYDAMKALITRSPDLLTCPSFAFISILRGQAQPHHRLVPTDSLHWLTLKFDDITGRALERIGEERCRKRFRMFDQADARAICQFLREHQASSRQVTLLVHCAAGVSRSGAVVTFARNKFGIDGDAFAADNPNILPNDIMLRMLEEEWLATGPA